MNEDAELSWFLKRRLEAGAAAEPPRMSEIVRAASESAFLRRRFRRRVLFGWGLSAAAAALAVICCFTAVWRGAFARAPRGDLAGVLAILNAADGISPPPDSESIADMLLAWQDAPYENALAGNL